MESKNPWSYPTMADSEHYHFTSPPRFGRPPRKYFTYYTVKVFVVIAVILSLFLFPSKPPELVQKTSIAKFWKLIHFSFIGIVVCYGLFSPVSAEPDLGFPHSRNLRRDEVYSAQFENMDIGPRFPHNGEENGIEEDKSKILISEGSGKWKHGESQTEEEEEHQSKEEEEHQSEEEVESWSYSFTSSHSSASSSPNQNVALSSESTVKEESQRTCLTESKSTKRSFFHALSSLQAAVRIKRSSGFSRFKDRSGVLTWRRRRRSLNNEGTSRTSAINDQSIPQRSIRDHLKELGMESSSSRRISELAVTRLPGNDDKIESSHGSTVTRLQLYQHDSLSEPNPTKPYTFQSSCDKSENLESEREFLQQDQESDPSWFDVDLPSSNDYKENIRTKYKNPAISPDDDANLLRIKVSDHVLRDRKSELDFSTRKDCSSNPSSNQIIPSVPPEDESDPPSSQRCSSRESNTSPNKEIAQHKSSTLRRTSSSESDNSAIEEVAEDDSKASRIRTASLRARSVRTIRSNRHVIATNRHNYSTEQPNFSLKVPETRDFLQSYEQQNSRNRKFYGRLRDGDEEHDCAETGSSEVDEKAGEFIRKFREQIRHERAPSESIDIKASEFIAKFREQIRLEGQDN